MKTARILCLDGGGIRGLIPASILAKLEKQIGPVSTRFHMLSGTSTGGIISCGLSNPRIAASKLIEFYKQKGPDIFKSSLGMLEGVAGPVYSAEPLEAAIKSVLIGNLSSVVANDLLITSYDIEKRAPYIFKSWKAQENGDDDYRLVDVARATSAAPTYFSPAQISSRTNKKIALVDGGVYANNPAMCAYVAARRLYPFADRYLIVSIGTGKLRKPFPYQKASDWGFVGWAQPLLSMMFDGSSDTIDYQLSQLAPEVSHFRYQVDLEKAKASDSMDNVTPENMDALIKSADQVDFSNLIDLLKEPLIDRSKLGYSVKKEIQAPKTFSKPKVHLPAAVAPTNSGIAGAGAGALLGTAVGGPIGAAIGAVIGFFGGNQIDSTKKKDQ